MGAFVSKEGCQSHYNITLNCPQNATCYNGTSQCSQIGDVERGKFPADPDIAGIGVVGAFFAVTAFALSVSCFYFLWQIPKSVKKRRHPEWKRDANPDAVSNILETLVLSCSDQQIFTGAAYALTLRYWRGCSITAYHYNIVANMLLLTCATHLMSITVVRRYWRYPWLALARVVLMTGLFIVTGVLLSNQNARRQFPTGVPMRNEKDSLLVLPAACFQSDQSRLFDTIRDSTKNRHSFENVIRNMDNRIQGWNFYLLILLWYGVAILREVPKLYRYLRRKIAGQPPTQGRACDRGPWDKWIHIIFRMYQAAGIGLSFATVVLAFHYIMRLRGWMDGSGWIDGKNPENDSTSFGQLVAIFLTALTVFAFIQVVNENISGHHKKPNPASLSDTENNTPSSQNGVSVRVTPVAPSPEAIDMEAQLQRPPLSPSADSNIANAHPASPTIDGASPSSPHPTSPSAPPAHGSV